MELPFLIAVDVGNSRIKFGLFADPDLPCDADRKELPECRRVLSISHADEIPWAGLCEWAAAVGGSVRSAVIAGVHPGGVEKILTEWSKSGWPVPTRVHGPADLPLRIRVDAPERVGIDRLLNAVAGNVVRPDDMPLIIVSSGTATTVDYVAPDGAFEGGAILPGLELGAQALHHYTALLPLVPPGEFSGDAPGPIGKNTRDAIRSGLFWGQVGAVRELIAKFESQSSSWPTVLVTGGAGALLTPQLGPHARYEEHLPLKGLALAAATW